MKPFVRPIVMVFVPCLVLAAIAKQLNRGTVSSPLSSDINATSMPVSRVWQTGFPLPAAKHKLPVLPADRPDTQQLKQSAWFSIISRQIEQDLYHFHGKTGDQQLQSENREQLITGTYSYNYMQLASMHGMLSALPTTKKNKTAVNDKDWDLSLRLKDIAFDGRPCYYPLKDASVQQHDSSLVFDHAGAFAVQYINTAEGVRQNFIVRHAPAGMRPVASIRVHMAVQSNLRAYAAAGGKELHFARKDNNTGGLRNELNYTGLKAWDANGHELAATMEPGNNGKEITIQVAASDAVYPITIDPLSTTIATTLNGVTSGDTFGYSLSTAGDVNGDGFSDVIVGTGAGNKAYVYLGGASGLSTTASWTTTQAGSYGSAVGTAGDVNGDGYSDVIVGAPGATKAYVYYGSSTGLSTTAAWTVTQATANFGVSVALAGDVNGDGYSDVVVGASGGAKAYGYYGSSTGPATTASWTVSGVGGFGLSVASAGDVNGDGYSDVIVGAGASNKAYVYFGGSTGLVTSPSWSSPTGAGNFGGSVASAGDVNGDGYSDVVIGSSSANRAYVYYGSSGGTVTAGATTLTGAGGAYGYSVACAGDVNADGYSDVIVGSNGGNNAFVYFGGSGTISTTVAWTGTGSGSYGFCVAPAGDINGDGFSDVIIGATGISTNTGAAYIYTGSPAGALTTITTTITGSAGQKGFNVASAGDVDGDGYSDVIIGVSGVPAPLGGAAFTGAAYVYLGSSTGLSTTASWSRTGTASSDFGSVSSAGDVNGDGYSDVIVGASGAGGNTGAAYVYLGSSSGLSTTVSWTGNGPAANSNYGYTLGCAGDVNGDGYSDIIVGTYAVGGNAGAAYVYYGGPSGPATTASWTGSGAVNSYYGGCVASAGDVNGDGYSDIIVGAPGVSSIAGAAYLYYGSATGLAVTPAWTKIGSIPNGIFGISVGCAGDINGDGYSDIIVSASGTPGGGVTGTAYVFNGGSGGVSTTASWTASGLSNSMYGWKVASAGDVNGDGYSDLIVGSYGYSGNTGAAYMYYGSSAGLSATASWTITGTVNSYLGGSVGSAGDVDGDGYSDVLVAPYGAAGGTASVYEYSGNGNASNDAGTVQLLNTNLTTPISASNRFSTTFGASVRPVSFIGATKGRVAWDV